MLLTSGPKLYLTDCRGIDIKVEEVFTGIIEIWYKIIPVTDCLNIDIKAEEVFTGIIEIWSKSIHVTYCWGIVIK